MDFYLQFGYGMMGHCKHLVDAWGGGTVILSPRDLEPNQLPQFACALASKGGRSLLDPQFYLPHADHHRLQTHDYWPGAFEPNHTLTDADWLLLLRKLLDLNVALGTHRTILPGILLGGPETVDAWLTQSAQMFAHLPNDAPDATDLMATVALSGEATRSNDVIHRVLDDLERWPVGGIYVVCEPPRGDYLVTDPNWLANLLDLVAGIRLAGKTAIVGYCTHQMLIAACAGATAIASGTWMNVRSFGPDKFRHTEDEERRKRLWYYCPQALSEYPVYLLDIALRLGTLDLLKPSPPSLPTYAEVLFSTSQPSTAPFRDADAFRHYLDCLFRQAAAARRATYDETMNERQRAIEEAATLTAKLTARRIRGGAREFNADVANATSLALDILDAERGPVLRRLWHSI